MSAPDVVTEMFAAYQTALRTLNPAKGRRLTARLTCWQTNGNDCLRHGKSGLRAQKLPPP